jgi:3-oxoacyl-[acyl-carrier protein] reductase
LLVLNAGISPPHQALDEVKPDVWRECIDTNLTGVFLVMHAAVPHLRSAGGGRIIVVGSGAGRRAPEGLGPYAASKAAVSALVRVAARELRPHRIAVNELQPGPTATRIHGVPDPDPEELSDSEVVLEGGLGQDQSIAGEWFKSPGDVANTALYLASLPPYGPTGQILSLNSVI